MQKLNLTISHLLMETDSQMDAELREFLVISDDVNYLKEEKDGLTYHSRLSMGKLHGVNQIFNELVTIKHVEYKNGLKHGESSRWNADGTKIRTTTYYEGEKIGPYTVYFKNGAKKIICELKYGKIHTTIKKGIIISGLYKEWYSNGILAETGIYNKGERDGEHVVYYLDGSLKTRSEFKKGLLYGRQINYDKLGEINHDNIYVNNKLVSS